MACTESLVGNNYITDATDGAIMVFGAPFTIVQNNTILAISRICQMRVANPASLTEASSEKVQCCLLRLVHAKVTSMAHDCPRLVTTHDKSTLGTLH